MTINNPMFPLFLPYPEKGPKPKWTIYKHVSEHSKKCLSVILELCLLFVVCSASAAYTRLCKGLKYLQKVKYIVLNYPKVA